MKRISKLLPIFLIGFTVLNLALVSAQPRSHDNLEARVEVSVSDTSVKGYIYSYQISNNGNSAQNIEEIAIEIGDLSEKKGGTINNITQINEKNRKWLGNTSRIKGKPINNKAKGHISWIAEYLSTENTSDIYLLPPESVLLMEETLVVSFRSKGLPTILRYWIRGWNKPYTESEYDSLLAVGYTKGQLSPPWYEDAYKGKTIAPVIPSDTMTTSDFLGLIDSYLNFSCDTTWVTNQGICNSLEVKIRNVKRHIERGQIKQAGNVLDAFLNEVEAQRGKHITEEGYALLYFNARYLRNKLNAQVED